MYVDGDDWVVGNWCAATLSFHDDSLGVCVCGFPPLRGTQPTALMHASLSGDGGGNHATYLTYMLLSTISARSIHYNKTTMPLGASQ